ncbi:MAG: PQQ-like beta-propeller repeat protein [Planctomycetes bacterium]|nr:PQQ-like beta-propeller repeat protein [Planctomycetota bacterium]
MLTRFFSALLLGSLLASPLAAENWPSFRGPTGMGQSVEKNLPTTWGGKDNTNILWKAPLPHTELKAKPDLNQSSPIVWNGKIVVTSSYWPADKTQKEFPEHHVTCYDDAGKKLWDKTVDPGPWLLTDLRGGYTAPTPVTDGTTIFVVFGSGAVAAFDFEGKQLWRKEIPEPKKFDVAMGMSPVLVGDTVIMLCDKTGKASHLLALDKKTGDTKWDEKRPTVNFSHTTPVLSKVNGKEQLLIGASNALQGIDAATGKLLWWANNDGDVPSPILAGGLVYCDSGRGGGFGIAVDPTGTGDVTKTHIKWKTDKKIGGLGSPIVAGDYLFRLRDPGLLSCWKMSTGETGPEERVQGVSTTASPFATADGLVYFVSAGRSIVVKPGAKLEILATNELGEDNGSSAAVSGGRIYVKGRNHLFAIGGK